jgi:lipopolysaccharide transport system permease protein
VASLIRIRADAPSWSRAELRELRDHRDLLYFLVWRDIKVLYAQTVLGLAWAIIRPVASMAVFSVIFGQLAQVASDGVPYPIFNYVALVPWTYFSTTATDASASLITNRSLLTKVYFPRILLAVAPCLSKLLDFVLASLVTVVLMFWYDVDLRPAMLLAPLLVVPMVVFSLGVGLVLAPLAVQYRDVKHGLPFLMQILLYAAPVVWPASLIAERYGDTALLVYGVFPMVGVIEGARALLLGTQPMPWGLLAVGGVSSVLLFVVGAFYFKRMEGRFADVA